MSVLCRTLLSVSANPEQRPAQDTLPCAHWLTIIWLRQGALGRDSACGGVKNPDVFSAGPRDGFTLATQAESRPNALVTTPTKQKTWVYVAVLHLVVTSVPGQDSYGYSRRLIGSQKGRGHCTRQSLK